MARAVAWRTETESSGQSQRSTSILNFRVDRFDDEGEPLPSLAVEMRGRKIRGTVNDGEWVEIPGSWDAGELLEPRRVRNLTTNTLVQAKRPGVVVTVFKVIVFLIFLAVFLLVAVWVIAGISQFGSL